MKKSPIRSAPPRNWVAKNMHKVCRPSVHKSKKKDYIRTSKHRHRDFEVSSLGVLTNG